MFGQAPLHTLDKIMAKLVSMKKISKLDLQPKGQGHSKKQKRKQEEAVLEKKIFKGFALNYLCSNCFWLLFS